MSKIPQMTTQQFNSLASTKASGQVNAAQTIAEVVIAGSEMIGGLAAKEDAKKRQKFDENVSLLSESQKEKFATQIAQAKDEDERLKLFSQFFVALANNRIDKIDDIIQQQEIQKRNALVKDYLVFGGITIGLILIFMLLNKDK